MRNNGTNDMAKLVPELLVSDFAKSFIFYTQTIGFKQLYGRPKEGFSYLDLDGAQIMIDQRQAGAPRDWVAAETAYPYGRGMNLEIGVVAVGPLFETCAKQGARIFLPLEDKWYRRDNILLGCRQFIVMDPDGYLLRFSQSLGTRPAEG